ncbi:MAG: hypothetical protein VXZ55_08575, partial [Planctomycetota bacterium]|nr:hypothetical protein [Planctomycetota bacterium]
QCRVVFLPYRSCCSLDFIARCTVASVNRRRLGHWLTRYSNRKLLHCLDHTTDFGQMYRVVNMVV